MSRESYREIEYTPKQMLGRELRKARLSAKYTQKELAYQIGRLTPYIQGVECGIDDIDPMTKWRWLCACGDVLPLPIDAQLPINANLPTTFTPPSGAAMRDVRLNACLTQVELAARLRCSQSYVCQVETDKCPVSDGVYRRWLRACGLPTSTVLPLST